MGSVRVVSSMTSEGETSSRSCVECRVSGVVGLRGAAWWGEHAVVEPATSRCYEPLLRADLMRYPLGHLRLSESQELHETWARRQMESNTIIRPSPSLKDTGGGAKAESIAAPPTGFDIGASTPRATPSQGKMAKKGSRTRECYLPAHLRFLAQGSRWIIRSRCIRSISVWFV